MLLSQRHGPLQVSYGYDRDKNLTALMALSGGEVLADNQYEYDGNGNRTKKRQTEGETRYVYDGLNQLTKIEYPTLTEELFYDKAGNRTRRTAGDGEDLYSYDPRNRLVAHTRDGVTTPLVYDDAGNLLRDGKAMFEYDGFNRAVKAETFDGNIRVNRYDAEGLRYELEENGRLVQFIFHQGDVVTERNETDTIRLIRGYDLIASDAQSARTYYHYASDELGSTTHIVDEKGKVLNRYAYDAFGNVTEQEEAVSNRFKFNGQQYDPITQQYYLRARFYNPVVARFTQEDLYRGDGLNLYAYCRNNPVVYEDPSGYLCESGQDLYRQYRDEGYTAAEAYYLTTGRQALTADAYAATRASAVDSASTHLGDIANSMHNGTPLTPEQTRLLGSYAYAFGDPTLLASNPNNPIAGAMRNLDSAQALYDSLPASQRDRTNSRGEPIAGRTVAVGEGTTASGAATGEVAGLSGFSHDKIGDRHLDNFAEPGYDTVSRYADRIGDPLTPQGGELKPGYNEGSHAEKQVAAVIGRSAQVDTVGVTRPMCSDCVTFYGQVSQYQGTNIYIAAAGKSNGSKPGQFHIFLPDKTHIASDM